MKPLKAPGIDGVHAFFFQKNWSVVGDSICQLVQIFFDGSGIYEAICHTSIVLISKQEKPESFKRFRSISLCNTIYKIITKVIAN